ncbi:MAG: pilus assembly protein PilM [Phycisphaerales bacterium]|nr:MAG: pilus assembly protein PilM [Phycisphaerales bacterium]
MKLRAKTVLGVDISEGLINMALLRHSAKGIELVKAASGPVPDGAIADGSIADSAALARAIKELKNHNKMQAKKAAVSLSVRPVVTAILETPEGSPNKIGQFVRDELKSYVALSGREMTLDFCGLKSGKGSGGRLLAVGANDEDVTELIKTYIRAGLNVETVEPELLCYVRTLYAERIESRFDCNVLLALLHNDALTLCVFRKQSLEFIRTEDISAEKAEPQELCRRLAAEINTIVQFYETEVADSADKWEVTVLADRVQLPDDAEKILRTETRNADLQVKSGRSAYKDVLVDLKDHQQEPSALAVGLAMGLLNVRETGLKINLVPPESAEVRSVKKQLVLTTIIVVAVIPLLAFLAGQGLSLLAEKVQKGIDEKKRTGASRDTAALVKEREFLEQQIELLSKRPEALSAVLGSRQRVDWATVLDDVKGRTPKAVRITDLLNNGETEMHLEGWALSYEAARLFVTKLNESDHISLATLRKATREDSVGGLVTYSIDCLLTTQESES